MFAHYSESPIPHSLEQSDKNSYRSQNRQNVITFLCLCFKHVVCTAREQKENSQVTRVNPWARVHGANW